MQACVCSVSTSLSLLPSLLSLASYLASCIESIWLYWLSVLIAPLFVLLCLCLQVSIPLWALVHLPVVVTVTTAIFTPQGWLHCILYVLFENAMGIVKLGAVIAGNAFSLLCMVA